MTTVFDSTRPVKPSARKPFAAGLARTPARQPRFEPTPDDLAWAAANLNANTTHYEVIGQSDEAIDFAYGCALATARHEAGFRCY